MPVKADVLLDTNILLRTSFDSRESLTPASKAFVELVRRGFIVGTSAANLAEFANVSTRPTTANGLGLSVSQAQRRIEVFERLLVVYSESLESYRIWKGLVLKYEVRGTQVHDARIAAVMMQAGISSILTFNTSDFTRYSQIFTLHPDHVVQADAP